MVWVPANRTPTHPGEMLCEEYLDPMGVTQRKLAQEIHVPHQRVNELINGKRGVTPSTALRLGKCFVTTSGFWMNLQLRWDLFLAQGAEALQLEKIQPNKPSTVL